MDAVDCTVSLPVRNRGGWTLNTRGIEIWASQECIGDVTSSSICSTVVSALTSVVSKSILLECLPCPQCQRCLSDAIAVCMGSILIMFQMGIYCLNWFLTQLFIGAREHQSAHDALLMFPCRVSNGLVHKQ